VDVVFEESTKNNMLCNNESGISNVVYIGYFMDIGDISSGIDSNERKELYMKLEQTKKEGVDDFFEKQADDLNKLVKAAKNGEQIRIWTGYQANNICPFAFLCDLLYDYECKISCIKLPPNYASWGGVYSTTYKKMLEFEQPLKREEMEMYKNEWQILKKENSPLRAVVNGHILSVPENFYDFLIEKFIPEKDTFSIKEIIGAFVQDYNNLAVGSNWLYLRINKMIESGRFKLLNIPDKDRPFSAILRKSEIKKVIGILGISIITVLCIIVIFLNKDTFETVTIVVFNLLTVFQLLVFIGIIPAYKESRILITVLLWVWSFWYSLKISFLNIF